VWWIKRAFELPPRLLLRKAATVGERALRDSSRWCRDRLYSSFASDGPAGEIRRHLTGIDLSALSLSKPEWLTDVCRNYLEHRFDLLGSDWTQVRHGMTCRGLEGYVYGPQEPIVADPEGHWLEARINGANLAESRRIWRLVDPEYTPIDWQLDFKSGYRWSERSWYLMVPYGHLPGVDIKVPWELARMQHLPQLAVASGIAARESAAAYRREFRNQVLDFIATNPPRFGVNWRGTMDVAIRAANWLLAYDLLRVQGATFDREFEAVFRRSIHEHGRHIAGNFEWPAGQRGNHYLAHIVGLLFVGVYLPRTTASDAWFAFALQELVREVDSQFSEDGANFEASTCYHRLSAEMVVYATALVLGLPGEALAALRTYDHRLIKVRPGLMPAPLHIDGEPSVGTADGSACFPAWYFERLERMAEFTMHATKPDGRVVQVGDNDSGRFAKIAAAYVRIAAGGGKGGDGASADDAPCWQESHLDHRHLTAAANVFFANAGFSAFAAGGVEDEILRALSRRQHVGSYRRAEGAAAGAESVRTGGATEWDRALREAAAAKRERKQSVAIVIPGDGVWDGRVLFAYPRFGLYIFRSRRVFLAVRCGPIGLYGHGAHAHNDQLAIELNVDGVDWICDPGTYLYSPLPERRDAYRSVRAHFAPRLADGSEPASLRHGLFRLGADPGAQCLFFGDAGFWGRHVGYTHPLHRLVRLTETGAEVVDWLDGEAILASPAARAITAAIEPTLPFSPGYGIQARC